jgi:outer membrane protein OmpA-like peptidoglycan-associated protein
MPIESPPRSLAHRRSIGRELVRTLSGLAGRSVIGSLLFLACAPSAPARLAAQGTIESINVRLEEARRAGIHLIAPRHFERAESELEDARRRRERGDSPEAVRQRITEAAAELDEVDRLANEGEGLFDSVLNARARALEAEAPENMIDEWAAAEEVFREAGLRFERDDRADAIPRAERAATLYRQAWFGSVRAERLGAALIARSAALSASARELAPQTFAEAEGCLAEADSLILGGPAEDDEVTRLGSRAAIAFRRATRAADVSDSVARREVTVEKLVRAHEADIMRLAGMLGLETTLSEGTPGATEEVAAEIRRLLDERDRLEQQRDAARTRGEDLSGQVESLERELAAVERREAEALARLGEREAHERKLREIRALFSPEQAEVLVSGDELTLRLFQLTFESGSDEILPDHHPTLTSVQRVLMQFPGAPVRIEGHTDARGNADANRALSQRRAIAIRDYLLTNLPISSDRLEATGYGEERPIAREDTEEGRARNRRIEIVLTIPAP